jgi:polysaccharide deacetylase family protein (PEP-CTERM system associated)
MLDLLAESPEAKATFFVLGKFADKHPDVVRAIDRAGHEVACHGHGHVEVFDLDRDSFAADIQRSTNTLADLIGRRPIGYRAPDFSITARSLWALEVLAEQGYEYDSSIFPIAARRYGIADWPRPVSRVRLPSGASIIEAPLATVKALGRRWPVSGGGYARLLPKLLLTSLLRRAAHQIGPVTVFYCHPYELDPGEFARAGVYVPWKVRTHQGLGRGRAAAVKLTLLLTRFECVSIAQALAELDNIPEMILPAPGSA